MPAAAPRALRRSRPKCPYVNVPLLIHDPDLDADVRVHTAHSTACVVALACSTAAAPQTPLRPATAELPSGIKLTSVAWKGRVGEAGAPPVIVDCDPAGIVTTQIFVGGFSVGTNAAGIQARSTTRRYSRWRNNQRNVSTAPRNAAAAIFQFAIPKAGITLTGTASSPILTGLQKALPGALGLIFQFTVYQVVPTMNEAALAAQFAKRRRPRTRGQRSPAQPAFHLQPQLQRQRLYPGHGCIPGAAVGQRDLAELRQHHSRDGIHGASAEGESGNAPPDGAVGGRRRAATGRRNYARSVRLLGIRGARRHRRHRLEARHRYPQQPVLPGSGCVAGRHGPAERTGFRGRVR